MITSQHIGEAADALRDASLDRDGAITMLSNLKGRLLYAIDAVTINRTGAIVIAFPGECSEIKGVVISDQSQVQQVISTMRPVASDVFRMAEGFPASDMQSPIFDASVMFIGSESAAIDLSAMIKNIVEEHLDLGRFQFTCLKTDGMEL